MSPSIDRRDGQPDTVFNTGALFFRASPRAIAFVAEWAERTLRTADIGNDQTELNRLLRSRYRDGDYKCNRPECLEADDRIFVPVAAAFVGEGCPRLERLESALRDAAHDASSSYAPADATTNGSAQVGTGGCLSPCLWVAPVDLSDGFTRLSAVAMAKAHMAWKLCEAQNVNKGRWKYLHNRRLHWMWNGR